MKKRKPKLSRAQIKYLKHLKRAYQQLRHKQMEHEPYHREKLK